MPEGNELGAYEGETFDLFERKLETTLNGEGLRDVMQHFKDHNAILPPKVDGEFQKDATKASILMDNYSLTSRAPPPVGGREQPDKTGEDLKQGKKFRENLGKAYKILDGALQQSPVAWLLTHETGTDEEEDAIGFYLTLGRLKVEIDTSQNVDISEFRLTYRKLDDGIPAPEHIIGVPRFVPTWKTEPLPLRF